MNDTVPPPRPPWEPPPMPSVPPPITPGSPPPTGAAGLPWETPGYPMLEGLYETARLFLTRPTEAFTRMQVSGDIGRPIGYAIILGWIGVIAGQAYSIALDETMRDFLTPFTQGQDFQFGVAFNIGMMIAAPILILLSIFIGAAIYHLFLMLFGAGGGGFPATVRVVCYATTTQVLQIVPLCGGLIGGVWTIVLEIIGLAIAHRTTQGKAALAVFMPLILCCVCLAVLFAAFGAAIMAAIGKMQ